MAFELTSGADEILLGEADLDRQVMELRVVEHCTIAEIAAKLDISESRARRIAKRALQDYIQPQVDELRAMEAAKLDALEGMLRERVKDGHLPSIDRQLKLMALRMDLFGLKLPPPRPFSEAQTSEGAKVLDVSVWQADEATADG